MTIVPPGTVNYLTTWPTGIPQPLVSTLNDPTGTVVANAAIVPAGTSESIDVYVTNQTDLIIDVNGYFLGGAGTLPEAKKLHVNADNPGGPAVWGTNVTTTSAPFTTGVYGNLTATTLTDGSGVLGYTAGGTTWGVRGFNAGPASNNGGVLGISGARVGDTLPFNAAGVRGESPNGFGVLGNTNTAAPFNDDRMLDVQIVNNTVADNERGIVVDTNVVVATISGGQVNSNSGGLMAFSVTRLNIIDVAFTGNYTDGPFSAYGNLAVIHAVGEDIVTSQFNLDPGDLAAEDVAAAQLAAQRHDRVPGRDVAGRDLGQELEVTQGLTGNEQVVSNPGERLADGVEVQVATPKQQAPASKTQTAQR